MHIWKLLSPLEADEAAKSYQRAKRLLADGAVGDAVALARRINQSLTNRARALEPAPKKVDTSIVAVAQSISHDLLRMVEKINVSTIRSDCELIVIFTLDTLLDHNIFGESDRVLQIGFDSGHSIARNIGISIASGDNIVFLNDQMLVEPKCIEELTMSMARNRAVAVSSRVVQFGFDISPKAGEILDRTLPFPLSLNSVSAVSKKAIMNCGGFDPIYDDQDGAHFSALLYRTHGPTASLIEPKAVAYRRDNDSPDHNSASSPTGDKSKLTANSIHRSLAKIVTDKISSQHYVARAKYFGLSDFDDEDGVGQPISILTTAYNAAQFVQAYYDSLLRQTTQSFEVIFVDDGSSDDTVDILRTVFGSDPRLKVIESQHVGRGAALNIALANASNDICLIADVDDVSLPYRFRASREVLSADPALDCMSLLIFDDRTPYIPRRIQPQTSDLFARSLFGMPVPFPAFAFRRSKFIDGFDPSVMGAIDFDWLARNMLRHGVRGRVIPIHGTYYRRHDNQISATRREQQRSTAIRWLLEFHRRLLDSMTAEDERLAALLAGFGTPRPSDLSALTGYVYRLCSSAAVDPGLSEMIANAMYARLTDIELALSRLQPSTRTRSGTPEGAILHKERNHADHRLILSWIEGLRMLIGKFRR